MLNILKKPHPFIFNKSSILLPGAITFLIIALLAPLNFQTLDLSYRIGFAILFGIIASASVWIIVSLIIKIYPDYEEKWTLGREIQLILTVIFVIALFVFFLFLGFDLSELKVYSLFQQVLINTLIISFFPVIILVLYEQYTHQKKQWKHAQNLTQHITTRNQPVNEMIQFASEVGKIELQLKSDEILYLKSDGNYVEVFYHNDSIKKFLLRNRLKAVIENLPQTHFFHCHKSYIVNKNAIIKVEGNARNFELYLRGVEQVIPVSRSKSNELDKFLSSP